MNDSYPATLSIEIDRQRLKNCLRAQWLLAWALPLSFFGGLFGFANIPKALNHGFGSRADIALLVVRCIGTGLGVALLLALFLYLVFSHRLAARLAASLEISVEGAFLRIRQNSTVLSDRKLHFRSIVDYATTQTYIMRQFGLEALQMTTTAGGPTSTITIPGVKDCLRVRDMLSEIDRLRENQ